MTKRAHPAANKFFIITTFLVFSPSISHAEDKEKLILLQLKDHWIRTSPSLTSWNNATPHCSWPGILCTDGSVTQISLPEANISSPIPPSICNLTNLIHLDLFNNSIPGPFPTFLYRCSNLRYLNLAQNYFAGSLPVDIHGLSPHLTYLDLSGNSLSGDIPLSIGRLSSLRTLLLHCNRFNGSFPGELGHLPALEKLTLAYNPFAIQSIPAEFGGLVSLKHLWMTQTRIAGEIPLTLSSLTQLEHLDLGWNHLNGSIPEFVWSMPKLRTLYLYCNNFSGEIRGQVSAFGLEEIDVSINQLNGSIPEGFDKLINLSVLFMYYNHLSGEIPRGIGLLPNLINISLFNNRLTGILPPELGKHSNLHNIEVPNNEISGGLPEGLCARRQLQLVSVFNNRLSGELPSSIANCHTLLSIQLYKNNFSGEFPLRIWSTAANLMTVKIHHNHFTGMLPDILPWNLTRFEIDDNLFSGKLPSSALNLLVFTASSNRFSGEIPTDFTRMSKLQVLLLAGNQISGKIPVSLSALKFLTELDLSNNHISGCIPAELGSLPVLTMLNFSRNELAGFIPPDIGYLKLSSLDLSYNHLFGEIPFQLQNQAYNFLSNPHLCSTKPIPHVQYCAHRSINSNKSSMRLILIFVVLSGVLFMMLGVIGTALYRRRPDAADLPPWKLTSFQQLDFTEHSIIHGLIDNNLIGSGGSGKVYRINVRNHGEEVTVAVKKICNNKKPDWKMEKAFKAEVKILSSIKHANIVKLLCCISNADSMLLVYEYMENGSLDQWLHGSRRMMSNSGHGVSIDWPKRLGIAIDAARGLCYMHHHCTFPVIHRDVKSSNILLNLEFGAKIADFGLARLLSKGGEPDTASVVAGTFGYMAPECGYSRKITEKMDVFSFGVVLLELTTRRKPLEGGEHEGLAGWAARQYMENGRVIEMIDEELIEDASYLDEIEAVLCLGIECTTKNPLYRPSMKEVLDMLIQCDHRNAHLRNFDIGPSLRCWRREKSSSDGKEEDCQNFLPELLSRGALLQNFNSDSTLAVSQNILDCQVL